MKMHGPGNINFVTLSLPNAKFFNILPTTGLINRVHRINKMGYTSSGIWGVNVTTQGRYQVARVQVTEQCSYIIVGFTASTYFGHKMSPPSGSSNFIYL
jgi:hypothetical protein